MAVDGTWKLTVNTPMGTQESTLVIAASGATLTGTQSAGHGEGKPIEDGSVSGTPNSFILINHGIAIDEARIPVRPEVDGLCEILGLDPLYLANEGTLVTVVPPDGGDWIEIRPSWASTNRLVVGRPRPLPFFLVVKNGMKILSRISGGTPGPVSRTATRAHRASLFRSMSTRPRSFIACTALISRL